MSCQRCSGEHIVRVSAKCGDRCSINYGNGEFGGYVDRRFGIGGGDYINFTYCLTCGQIQGEFPIVIKDEDEDERF